MRKKIMGKKTAAFVLALGMLFSVSTASHAETLDSEWNVSFTAQDKMESDYTASDLSSAVYSMQPGDSMEIRLHLKNDNASPSNWYMTNKVLQSLEESGTGASGGAYEYELTYTAPDGTAEILFTSDTVGGENTGGRIGLHGATSGLEDYFYLDTLSSGQQGEITLRVALDGETQGNDYQNTLASLQMNFAVDTNVSYTETVTEVVDEEVPGDGGNNGGNGADGSGGAVGNGAGGNGGAGGNRTNAVKTADENDMGPFIIAAAISGLLLLIITGYSMAERRRQRKAVAKGSALLLALCMAFSMKGNVSAQGEYTYTVRLFSGAQGSIDGGQVCRMQGIAVPGSSGEVYEISGLHYGDQVTFNVQSGVAMEESSKYYVRGIRLSGEDNSTVGNLSFTVTGDQDYVVAYGIKGATVAYTVNYLDEDGNALAPSETYYGNVGDKPVVAYLYIEGYQPQAYNLGKTLVEDATQNVFSFIYAPITVDRVVNRVVNTVTVPVPAPEEPAPPQPTVQPQAPVPVQTQGPQEDVPAPEETTEPVEIGENDVPTTQTPENYRDLDDENVPQGNYNGEDRNAVQTVIEDFATPLAMMPTSAKVGIGAGIVALAGGLLWLILFYKKREKEDEQ